MNMKTWMKSMMLGLAAATVLGIAGCGDGGDKTAPKENGQAASALMQKIKKDGKLIVGTASGYPPFEFVDTSSGDKKVIGIDMALAQKVADKLGVKLEVQDMNFQALLSSLSAGKIDVAMAGISPTEERKKSMDFSIPYLPTAEKIIIRKSDMDKYHTVEDFYGKTIGVQKSTTEEDVAKEKLKDAKIVALALVPEVILELKQGKVDGLVVEGIVGEQYTVFNDDLTFSSVELPDSVQISAAALPKNSEDVKAVIDEVIQENTDNGNFDKWVKEYSKKAVQNADAL